MESYKTNLAEIFVPGHHSKFIQNPVLQFTNTGKAKFKNSGVSKNKNFAVLDTIRFIAMCSIVWGHCNLGCETRVVNHLSDVFLQSFILQLGRIGTIIFFLISGLLMEPKIENYSPWSFLKLRFKSTILPWMVIVLLFSLLSVLNNNVFTVAVAQGHWLQAVCVISVVTKNAVFYFAYWFIVVFIISAVLLIALKKHINTIRMGLALGLITLFYSINLHYGWVSAYHTKAFLGYAFFMWLGMQIGKNHTAFIKYLNNTPWLLLLPLFALSFIIAGYEGVKLTKAGCVDPYASIRISNIMNSIIAFACLYKAGKIEWVNKLNPKKNAYGIYLIHNIVVYQLIQLYQNSIKLHSISISYLMMVEVATFAIVLVASYIIVVQLRIFIRAINLYTIRLNVKSFCNRLYNGGKVIFNKHELNLAKISVLQVITQNSIILLLMATFFIAN